MFAAWLLSAEFSPNFSNCVCSIVRRKIFTCRTIIARQIFKKSHFKTNPFQIMRKISKTWRTNASGAVAWPALVGARGAPSTRVARCFSLLILHQVVVARCFSLLGVRNFFFRLMIKINSLAMVPVARVSGSRQSVFCKISVWRHGVAIANPRASLDFGFNLILLIISDF